MNGVLYAVGGHVTYDPAGTPPAGYVLSRDGVWRHPDDLDAEALLWNVRKILLVPEGESLTAWATTIMSRANQVPVSSSTVGGPSDSWGVRPVGTLP